MRAKFEFTCDICKDRTPVQLQKKPTHFSPAYIEVTCTCCETLYGLTIKPKRGDPGQIDVLAQPLELGQRAESILMNKQKGSPQNANTNSTAGAAAQTTKAR